MANSFISEDAEVLFSEDLDPDTFTLVGTIPNKYPTGITLFVTNTDPKNTIMTQVIITRHRTANAANVFNKSAYVPPGNMSKFTNFTNIAGMNIFVKVSGTHSRAVIIHEDVTNQGRTVTNATPTVINQDQTVVAMPRPKMGNSNSLDTQLVAIRGQIAALGNSQTEIISTAQQNYNQLSQSIASLLLSVQRLTLQVDNLSTITPSTGSGTNTESNVSSTVIEGASGGIVTVTSILNGYYKKIILNLVDYRNDTSDAQIIPYPVPYGRNPLITSNVPNLAISTNLNELLMTAILGNTVYNGVISIEGT